MANMATEQTESLPNITRIDHGHTHGWQVRVQYGGEVHGRYFADQKHGGKQSALEKAKTNREEILEALEGRPPTKPEEYDTRFLYQEARNNSTGVVGVYRTIKKMKSGNRYPYYETTIHVEKGKAITRARSVQEHGELEAFLQICRIRKEHMQQIYGDRFDQEKFNQQVERYKTMLKQNASVD
ncbi:hypothetical protein [Halalkalibaculum sp. DA384]|uniref:hypothetical protein n=1 Tax=Halalkalibaculum sp. DA384 TaxID=3373606 RepID=UPI0037549AF8